jgi:hypothetical protein
VDETGSMRWPGAAHHAMPAPRDAITAAMLPSALPRTISEGLYDICLPIRDASRAEAIGSLSAPRDGRGEKCVAYHSRESGWTPRRNGIEQEWLPPGDVAITASVLAKTTSRTAQHA